MQLQTSRLLLRRWQPTDIDPFAAMNADPDVMEFFPNLLSHDQSRSMVESIESKFDSEGFGLWAVEIQATNEFIGFIGLNRPRFESHFTPCVEVGWRLARPYWGKGYAPEGAAEAIRDGFERMALAEIVSFTATVNKKSIRVMEKLNMKRDPAQDFLHPLVADGNVLKPHVLYRLSHEDWLAGR